MCGFFNHKERDFLWLSLREVIALILVKDLARLRNLLRYKSDAKQLKDMRESLKWNP